LARSLKQLIEDAKRLRSLIRLLLTQIVRWLTETMRFEEGRSVADYRHRLLLLLESTFFGFVRRGLALRRDFQGWLAGHRQQRQSSPFPPP